ncbi:MAG: glycoside hydrolase family 3 C-terminal domain-containing protein [Propionibacteriaceae bacterium]|jgi:beta-glucosidase|nr:glycoside hydrolase family 3 C-terminal domain-containing protein [Propionibacteriaceae bacterium]
MTKLKHLIVAGATAALAATGILYTAPAAPTASAAPDLTQCPWMDTTKTAAERATILLDNSTLGQTMRWLDEQAASTPDQTVWGPGFMGGDGATYEAAVACAPTVVYTDGPDVVRHAGATLYPAPIALASSWDLGLSEAKGSAFAWESYNMGYNGIWAPGLHSGRVALSGRTPEYLGEDSLLGGSLAAAQLQGMAEAPVVNGVKHYVANEQEANRTTSSSNISERALHEVYSLPFEIAVKDGDPNGVMCSYNQVNGAYACENPILNDILKDDIGFEGFVVSDFGAVHSTVPSLVNGLDMELNAPNYFAPDKLQAALDAGQITEAQIREAAYRVVKEYFAAGVFDTPLPETPATDVSTAANKAIARQMAEEGSVLLKNEGAALPLASATGLKVAIIGGVAGTEAEWEALGVEPEEVEVTNPWTGTTSIELVFPFSTALDSCSMSGTDCSAMVSPLKSFTDRVQAAGGTVAYAGGDDVDEARAVAAAADVAIVFGYLPMSEFSDAASLSLTEDGDALIAAVAAAAPKTVAVLETGSATDMPWLGQVDAVVQAWYPGEQAGPALSALLWGDVSFSGKLPMTYPKSLAQSPTSTTEQFPGVDPDTGEACAAGSGFPGGGGSATICQINYTEDLAVGYKWYDEFDVDPLFEFGFGLSYTTFAYSNLAVAVTPKYAAGTATVTVEFDVTNSGTVAGAEIPQVYLTLPQSSDTPGKRLVAFDRIELAAGETRHVTATVSSEASDHPLSVWSETRDTWELVPGAYSVAVGSSSRDIRLSANATVDVTPPDKTALAALVAQAQGLTSADHTPSSWAPLPAALAVASAVLADPEASPAQVAAAFAALDQALDGLVEAADKAALRVGADKAKLLDAAAYTESSWAALTAALKTAEAVLANPEATQAQVDQALTALDAARAALQTATPPPGDGGGGGKLPSTGATSPGWTSILAATLVLLGTILLVARRRLAEEGMG